MSLLEKNECFGGDVSIEKQVQSVPDILIKFISIILQEGDFNRSLSQVCTKYPPILHRYSFQQRKEKKK